MKPLVYKKRKRVRHAPPVRVKLHVAKGDTVQVISGDDKGKRGAVLRVHPKTGRVTVQGVNFITRHQRATQTSEGGKIVREAPIHHAKVMLIDPKSSEPTRVRRQRDADGTVERIAVKSGQSIARSR
jgi:large subunit ribosomal protein L24